MGYKHKNKVVHTKLTAQQVNALFMLYEEIAEDYRPENAHEQLLKGHISEMHDKLDRLLTTDQHRYTFSMCGTEALAFVQLFDKNPMPADYGYVVNMILEKIDKKAKSPVYAVKRAY